MGALLCLRELGVHWCTGRSKLNYNRSFHVARAMRERTRRQLQNKTTSTAIPRFSSISLSFSQIFLDILQLGCLFFSLMRRKSHQIIQEHTSVQQHEPTDRVRFCVHSSRLQNLRKHDHIISNIYQNICYLFQADYDSYKRKNVPTKCSLDNLNQIFPSFCGQLQIQQFSMLRAGPHGIDQSFLLQMRGVLVQNVYRYMTFLSTKEASASALKGMGRMLSNTSGH